MSDLVSLRGAARARGIKLGTVVDWYNIDDPTVAAFVASTSDIVVAEESMKMFLIQPAQGVFDFGNADIVADFAATNGMDLRFHTLIWHAALPSWAPAAIAANWQSVMDSHIAGIGSRYSVRSCDVVNEAIGDDGNWRTESDWYQAAGSIDYVRRAFEKAALALPVNCKKLYCDYGFESMPWKAEKLVELVTTLKADGYIDGVAMQCHINAWDNGFRIDVTAVADLLAELKALGLTVDITELDSARRTSFYSDSLFKQVTGDVVRQLVQTWIEADVGGVELLRWSIKDDLSWLHAALPDADQFPAPFTSDYRRNPMFFGIRQALTE